MAVVPHEGDGNAVRRLERTKRTNNAESIVNVLLGGVTDSEVVFLAELPKVFDFCLPAVCLVDFLEEFLQHRVRYEHLRERAIRYLLDYLLADAVILVVWKGLCDDGRSIENSDRYQYSSGSIEFLSWESFVS